MNKRIELPCYGIVVHLKWDKDIADSMQGTIESDLHELEAGHDNYNAMIDGLESLILAHCVAGVNIESLQYIEGIEVAVESIDNHS